MTDAKPLFEVRNKHAASSGEPPRINGSEKGKYHGHFENEYGEQAVFVYDYETGVGTLYMGDAGWDEPLRIEGGIPNDLVLNEAEMLWLGACLKAAASWTE